MKLWLADPPTTETQKIPPTAVGGFLHTQPNKTMIQARLSFFGLAASIQLKSRSTKLKEAGYEQIHQLRLVVFGG